MRLTKLLAGLVMTIGLSVSPGYASWSIDLRPLENKPYGRNISPLFKMGVEVLSHFEGAGIEVKRGRQDLFSVSLAKDGKPEAT